MFAIGYVNRPTLPTTNSRSPVTKKILSISWKIDHFQTRSGIIQSVLFTTNSLSSAGASLSVNTSGESANVSADSQPSEIWCLELDTNRSPFEDRGAVSMQQEPNQQVPTCNNLNKYSAPDQRRLFRSTLSSGAAPSSSANRNNPNEQSGFINATAANSIPNDPSNSSRVGTPDFEVNNTLGGGGGGGGGVHAPMGTPAGHSASSSVSHGASGVGVGGTSSTTLMQQQPHAAVADSSSSSNYMSLYLRLVYCKQEFTYVHLKAGVFTDRMDVTVLGEKDFQTDEGGIGWAQFLNKESVGKFILGGGGGGQNEHKQEHMDKQGYIQLYLELILNETKRKEGVECKALAHSDLIMDLSSLLSQKSLSDVQLVCGDKKLHVHKALLAARSPIFRAMFMHPSQENQTNQIELKDVEWDILEELINFIYTGQVARLDLLADSLLPVADKYAIVSLVKLCEESLSFNLTVDNVVHRLVLSYLHNAVTLKRAALGFIERNICTVRLTEGWIQAQLKYPQLFLDCFPFTEQLSLIVSKSMMSF